MVRYRLAVAVILAASVAACATSPGRSPRQAVFPSGSPQVANLPDDPSPFAATATPSTPPPTLTVKPNPRPTPRPVPPKPSGVKLDYESEAICGDDPQDTCAIGDDIYTLHWKAPRTKGVEIRVYGVTTCFGADGSGRMIDGHCLRVHTALPEAVRVLLAQAPASKGTVTWRLAPGGRLGDDGDGAPIHSIVVAAYDSAGAHSIFAIADAGDYCRIIECP